MASQLDSHLEEIIALRKVGKSWRAIATDLEKKHGLTTNHSAIRQWFVRRRKKAERLKTEIEPFYALGQAVPPPALQESYAPAYEVRGGQVEEEGPATAPAETPKLPDGPKKPVKKSAKKKASTDWKEKLAQRKSARKAARDDFDSVSEIASKGLAGGLTFEEEGGSEDEQSTKTKKQK